MDIKYVWWKCVNWTHVPHGRPSGEGLVSTVIRQSVVQLAEYKSVVMYLSTPVNFTGCRNALRPKRIYLPSL